jgi:uroporphyrinogen III methyltransferase/synthase
VVCRAVDQAGPLVSLLEREGATTVLLPLVEVVAPRDGGDALRDAVRRLTDYAWVGFTSANAVPAVVAAMDGQPWPDDVQVAVVGAATAARARTAGLPVHLVGTGVTGGDLARDLAGAAATGRVLLPAVEGARPELAAGLRDGGWSVDQVTAYRTVAPAVLPDALARVGGADAVLFSSPSTVDRFLDVAGSGRVPAIVVAIGPTTASRAVEVGLSVSAVAARAGDDGLVAALCSCWPPAPGAAAPGPPGEQPGGRSIGR